MDTKQVTQTVIDKCGGVEPMAKMLGYPRSTVRNWKDRGAIPTKQQAAILQAAQANGVDLKPADFFPPIVQAGNGAQHG